MILLIDNYDSFTYNLYQAFAGLGAEVEVSRNDAITPDEVLAANPTAVVLSPGPGRPADAGICLDLLGALPLDKPLLGVCLGHQSIVEFHGGSLEVDAVPTHGKASPVRHDGEGLFQGLDDPLDCGRYHSLRAVRADLPGDLKLSAWLDDGAVMGVRHASAPRYGVQFHPESILTPSGSILLANFLRIAGIQTTEIGA